MANVQISQSDIEEFEEDIVRITNELFPGMVVMRMVNDPEYPEDTFPVVEAEASGEITKIVARRKKWHERLREHSPELVLPLTLAIQE